MSLFDRFDFSAHIDRVEPSAGLTPERIREVCDAIGEPTIPAPLHPERSPFTPEELDRLWCAIFPDEQPIERRLSPAERARFDQLRAEFRDTL